MTVDVDLLLRIVSVLVTPAVSALFYLHFSARSAAERALSALDAKFGEAAEKHSAFQLKVAEQYVSKDALREVEQRITTAVEGVERRLTAHLVRIEGSRPIASEG